MKIVPKAVEGYLASPDPIYRAVLLYGPDTGLVRERSEQLSKHSLLGNQDPFAFTELNESTLLSDPARLADELGAISLMGGKRVIVLRDASDKSTRIIEDASSYFDDSVFLIVSAGELSTRSSLRAWFEKGDRVASIACYQDDARDLYGLIRQTFEQVQIRIDRDTIEYLAQQLGNDRYVTRQELEKLVAYAYETKHLQLEEAQALVDYNRESNYDDVVNAVADKNLQALEKTLTLLLREGTQPVTYLRALQRYFNRLYAIRAQMAAGQSPESVIQSLRPPVFFKQVPLLTRHAQNWNSPQIIKALTLLINAELACKTSDMPPVAASSRKLLQVTQVR